MLVSRSDTTYVLEMHEVTKEEESEFIAKASVNAEIENHINGRPKLSQSRRDALREHLKGAALGLISELKTMLDKGNATGEMLYQQAIKTQQQLNEATQKFLTGSNSHQQHNAFTRDQLAKTQQKISAATLPFDDKIIQISSARIKKSATVQGSGNIVISDGEGRVTVQGDGNVAIQGNGNAVSHNGEGRVVVQGEDNIVHSGKEDKCVHFPAAPELKHCLNESMYIKGKFKDDKVREAVVDHAASALANKRITQLGISVAAIQIAQEFERGEHETTRKPLPVPPQDYVTGVMIERRIDAALRGCSNESRDGWKREAEAGAQQKTVDNDKQ